MRSASSASSRVVTGPVQISIGLSTWNPWMNNCPRLPDGETSASVTRRYLLERMVGHAVQHAVTWKRHGLRSELVSSVSARSQAPGGRLDGNGSSLIRAAVATGACDVCGRRAHPPRMRLTLAKLAAVLPLELGL